MASWTDTTPPQFNQYVQQLPVEAMVEVGMHKQQKYEEGIQKIQTSIDNIAGLDVVRDVDKAYLQSKLNQLGNNLKFVSAGDFSDFQLTNTTVSMTNNLANDPGIQTAVSSTAKYRKELSILEKDRTDGKLTPENEYYFNKQASAWFNDSNVRTGFSGKYVPFFDVFKYTKEVFDAVKPDELTFDQIFETDSNGNMLIDPSTGKPVLSHYMKRLEKEGIFPEKVKETLDQVFSDGRVNQQLNISGQYNYRNVSPSELVNKLSYMRDRELQEQNDALINLKIKKYFGEPVDDMIDKVSSNIEKTNAEYTELAQTADQNPDAIRGMMYKNETRDNFTKMFSWSKVKETVHDSPAFRIEFDLQKEANRRSEWAQEQEFNRFKWAKENELGWAKLKQDYELALLKESGGGKGDGNVNVDGTNATQGPESAKLDATIHAMTKYEEAADKYSTNRDTFIWDMLLVDYGSNSEQIVTDFMEKNNVSRNKAISAILKNTAKQKGQSIETFRAEMLTMAKKQYNSSGGKVSKLVQENFKELMKSERNFNVANQVRLDMDKAQAAEIEKLGLTEDFKNVKGQTITYKDKQYNLSAQDKIDIATYIYGNSNLTSWEDDLVGGEGANIAAQNAFKRLQAKGLGEIAEKALKGDSATTARGGFVKNMWDFFGGVADAGVNTFQYESEGFSKNLVNERIGGLKEIIKSLEEKSFSKVTGAREAVASKYYQKLPNADIQLKTGDNETDKKTLSAIRTFVGSFNRTTQQNSSPTFNEFSKLIMEENPEFFATSTVDERGNPAFSINVLNAEGKVGGSMLLLQDQALKVKLDPSKIYESPTAIMIKEKINKNGGKTSVGNPGKISTYKNGEYVLDESAGDFPNVTNSNYRVKVNIAKGSNGLYFPYIYATDGQKENVYEFTPQPSVDMIQEALKMFVNDKTVEQIINSK